ncbi:MAG: oligosaccharide flippase family protein [bacterium]|nr:oligosaccharide flippase family protein [bacterium]
MKINFKEKFIKSTIILVVGGLLTKVLGMVIRIITTRTVGVVGTGLYMLINPTFNLFITIASLSLPTAISKLVAEDVRNNKKIVLGIIPIALIFDFLLIIIIFISANFIAGNLLQNENLFYPILAIAITLPFITTSSILRGYFFGKQKMFPHVLSNIVEQIVRIILITLITPYLLEKSLIFAVSFLVLTNVVSEIASILVFLFFIPKNLTIKKEYIKPDTTYIKDIFAISIPTTLSRLISSISLFLEPIILTFVFFKLGYDNNYITYEYGIITGYVFPIIMMPNFLTGAISSALLPDITRNYTKKNIKEVKRRIKQSLLYSVLIGLPFCIFLFLFPEFSLNLIYKTTIGANYLRLAAILFFISYILGPLSSILQTINKSKTIFTSSLIGSIIKISLLFLLSYLDIGMYPIIISYFVSFLYITIHQYKVMKKVL